MRFSCGPFQIDLDPTEFAAYRDHSPSVDDEMPKSHEYFRVAGPDGISLILDYQSTLQSENPERLVVPVESEGLKALEAFVQGTMRLMILPMEGEPEHDRVALRQAYLLPGDPRERPRRHRPEMRHLNEGARLDIQDTLQAAGAERVGTREELGLSSGDGDRAKNLLVAVFPAGNRSVPLVTYVLTRVLPVYYRYCPDKKLPNRPLL